MKFAEEYGKMWANEWNKIFFKIIKTMIPIIIMAYFQQIKRWLHSKLYLISQLDDSYE